MCLSHCINIPSLAGFFNLFYPQHISLKNDFTGDKLFHNNVQNHLNHIWSPWQYENINVCCIKMNRKLCYGGVKKHEVNSILQPDFFFFLPLCSHKYMMQPYCLLKYTHRQENGYFFHPICLLFRHNHWFTSLWTGSSSSRGACEPEYNKILV